MLKTLEAPVSSGVKTITKEKRRVSPEKVMEYIAGKFKTLKQYENFVVENNLVDLGFPLNPRFMAGYPKSTDAILGNPPGTYKQWLKEDIKTRKPWANISRSGRSGRKKKIQVPVVRETPKAVVVPKPTVNAPKTSIKDDNILLEVIKILESKYYVPMEYLFLIKDTSNIDKSDAVEITDYLIERMTNKLKSKSKV